MNNIFLVDAPGYIHRAWHATAPLHTSTGQPVNAAFGFTRMVLKLLSEMQPTHIAMCYDLNGRAGRQQVLPEYKTHRPKVDNELSSQYGLIDRISTALGISSLMYDGWEADDVIATVSKRAIDSGDTVTIVTSDKDFIQLLRPGVAIFDPVKAQYIDSQYVMNRYGISPDRMIDYQSLIGDPTDNVPKVPGIGPKTAAQLINKYGNILNILENMASIEPKKIKDAIASNVQTILIANELVKFKDSLPIEYVPDALLKRPMDDESALSLFKELEFRSIIEELWGINMHFGAVNP